MIKGNIFSEIQEDNLRKIKNYKLTIFFLFFTLIGFLYLFFNGVHNLDLGQNLYSLGLENNITIIEVTTAFETTTPFNLYILGLKQVLGSVILILFNALFLGYYFGNNP